MAKKLKVGDIVRLRKDVLIRHARSVSPHAGYTKEQFSWRETLKKLEGKKGIVTRVFSSGHVNVQFNDVLIGIDESELVKVGSPKRITQKKRSRKARKR